MAGSSGLPTAVTIACARFGASGGTGWMAWLPEDLTSARKEMFLASWDESHPLPGSSPAAQVPEPRRTQPAERRNSARGRGLGAAWARPRGGAGPPPFRRAGCVLTQHARPGVGLAAEARGLLRPAPWPRPWPISTTPTWATSTTVRREGCERGPGTRRFRDRGCVSRGRELTDSVLPSPQGLGTL